LATAPTYIVIELASDTSSLEPFLLNVSGLDSGGVYREELIYETILGSLSFSTTDAFTLSPSSE